ncbi:g9256 [Coccomyxa viridis]|uniref:G9256 protein n=1 Tax=Coccomyxa viridis TaxID=1274662 RepID=A0ABP1G2G8_9CHLO
MEAGQIIARTLEELDKSPRLLRALDEVSHVFLDEAQDLNLERYKVIDSLMANKAMMVVGDPRQCIYQGLFHADPTLMTRFRSDWVHRTLSTSYRLTKQMAEFVNAGFQYPSLPPMTSGNTYDGPKPTLVVIHGGMEEPDAFKMCRDSLLNSLIAMILHIIDGGAAPGTIAVLSPTKKSGSAAAHLMNRLRTHLERLHVPTYLNSREYDSPDTGGHARRETLYLGTCHSFKGSERDHVLLINFYVAPGAYTRLDSSKEENPDLMNLLYVACTRARRSLHIVESCHYPKATRVTEILGHLDGNDLDILEQRVVSSDSVRCYGKKTRLRTPKIFVQNCDADLYGNFIEAVLARAFSEGTANTDDVCQQIMAMPLYLTDREFRDLLQGVRDAVHPDKFRHTKIDPQWLSSFVVALVAAKNPPEAIKRSLRDKSVIVFTRSSLFYEKLATLFTVIDRIGKTATPTEDVVDAIWEATLLKTFHNNYLGTRL